MGKSYRRYLPEQGFLLSPSLREWLPENHLVYLVSDVVDHLNLAALDAAYGDEQRGPPPYDPRMMTKVLGYGYCVGVFSSRRIERRLIEDVGFRVLAAGNTPNFRTIADFRKLHLATLAGLFEEVLQIALEAGALKLGRVALDGTKVQANASKHKAMSYGRMKERERQLRAEVRGLLAQAEAADAAEDAHYGVDRRGDELPAELQRRESRLKKIRAAQRALEERARQSAEKVGKPREEVQQAKPTDKDQYNFTDPESRLMKGSDGLVQGYNAQAAVEPVLQLIVGQSVTPAANDKQQIEPMVQVEQQSGQRPAGLLADSGYCSEKNLAYLAAIGQSGDPIEAYIATGKQKHDEYRQPCSRGPLPRNATRVERMKRKLQTKAGRAIYATRKTIVEPVFGQIKQARGFRQFLLRGLAKVQGEWALVCLTHNILKLHRLCNA